MVKKVGQGNNNQYPKKTLPETNGSSFNLKDELIKELPKEFWQQITAAQKSSLPKPKSEIRPGQTISFKEPAQPSLQESHQKQVHLQEKLDFQRRINLTETSLRLKDRQKTEAKINLIREEIKTITSNMAQMGRQVKEMEISAQANITQPTRYQLNFLELLLEFLKDLREKIEEGNTWLTAFQKKSNKKNYFWNQVKKSGTRFLLSSDRTPATQTG